MLKDVLNDMSQNSNPINTLSSYKKSYFDRIFNNTMSQLRINTNKVDFNQ